VLLCTDADADAGADADADAGFVGSAFTDGGSRGPSPGSPGAVSPSTHRSLDAGSPIGLLGRGNRRGNRAPFVSVQVRYGDEQKAAHAASVMEPKNNPLSPTSGRMVQHGQHQQQQPPRRRFRRRGTRNSIVLEGGSVGLVSLSSKGGQEDGRIDSWVVKKV